MSDGITAIEAARRLGTSKPTVRKLIENGVLTATREKHGTLFHWRIEVESVARYLATHGRVDERRRKHRTRASLEAELDELRRQPEMARSKTATAEAGAERERVLREEVANLREALARTRAAVDLQRQADEERARVIDSLLTALGAAEQADALRQRAFSELEEALATFTRSGHFDYAVTGERVPQEPR